jgi:hypothetical protein
MSTKSVRNGDAVKAVESKPATSIASRVAKLETTVAQLEGVLKAIVTNQVMQAAAPAALQRLEAEIGERIDSEGLGGLIPS